MVPTNGRVDESGSYQTPDSPPPPNPPLAVVAGTVAQKGAKRVNVRSESDHVRDAPADADSGTDDTSIIPVGHTVPDYTKFLSVACHRARRDVTPPTVSGYSSPRGISPPWPGHATCRRQAHVTHRKYT